MKLNFERLIVDTEPQHCLFTSEAYVVLTKAGLTVAADVIVKKVTRTVERTLLISPQSLSQPLVERMANNSFKLSGIEVWVYKSGGDRSAKYCVED